ncbi:MAG: aromatic ring-hydroxylating oxygenase subunit alpha [Novosphingobium sp.]|uniref:aromatic ring-hydroxylating oxygenase subunit alpha n=1 Tax=Novosphingobium sp. TaxID=1874826 RepID=UPI003B9C8624
MTSYPSVAADLALDRPGFTLPRDLYVGEDAYRFDSQVMLKSVWLYACTVAHVKKPGDFYVFELGNNSVMIIRGKDGEVRAFYNTCTHRGARICGTATGNAPRLTCPYHYWSFNLDGRLLAARDMPEGFDKSAHGLRPVALENAGGLLFVCLSENPPPFDRAGQDIAEQIGIYNLDKLKVAYVEELIDHANWKLVMENNRECYHCEGNHPELLKSLDGTGFGKGLPEDNQSGEMTGDELAIEAQRAEWEKLGIYRELIEFPDGWWHRVARLGLASGTVTQTLDGQPACRKLIWPHGDKVETSLSIWTQPNSWHHFCCDHVVTFSLVPLGADKTMLRTSWLVHEDAVEGEDYDVDNLTAVWRATNAQDGRLAENNHAGIRSDAYRPGMYSNEEKLVEAFKSFYVKTAKAALGME